MNYTMKSIAVTLCATALIAGCVTAPEIVKTSDNHYSLTRVDKGGSFDDIASTRQALINEANAFAAKQGKVAVKVAMKDTPLSVQGYTSVEYQFELLSKAESDAIVVESAAKTGVTPAMLVQTNALNRSGAVYDALVKLDDLHKRGILTDAEFASQKTKILEGN